MAGAARGPSGKARPAAGRPADRPRARRSAPRGASALRILGELGAAPDAGGRLTLSKAALGAAVEAPAIAGTLALRQKKERGKRDVLALKSRFPQAQSLRFPLVERSARWRVAELPAALSLAPGRLTVEFADLPDLLWQLEVLVATLADDRAAAEALAAPGAAG